MCLMDSSNDAKIRVFWLQGVHKVFEEFFCLKAEGNRMTNITSWFRLSHGWIALGASRIY